MGNIMDLHHKSSVVAALTQQEIATDTTTVGETIDMAGYEALEIVGLSGTITDGTYTVALYEGDESDMSDEAVVAAAETLGAMAWAATDDDTAKKLGYIGKKRYVRIKVVSASTSTGVDMIGAIAVKSSAHHVPTAD